MVSIFRDRCESKRRVYSSPFPDSLEKIQTQPGVGAEGRWPHPSQKATFPVLTRNDRETEQSYLIPTQTRRIRVMISSRQNLSEIGWLSEYTRRAKPYHTDLKTAANEADVSCGNEVLPRCQNSDLKPLSWYRLHRPLMLRAQRAPRVLTGGLWELKMPQACVLAFLPYKGIAALGKGRLKTEPCSLVMGLLYIRDCYFP